MRHFLAFALIGTVACGVRTTVLSLEANSPRRPPRPATSVEMFYSRAPARSYREVALLRVEEESVYATADENAVWSRLRADAGQLGCDGLLVAGRSGTVASDLTGHNARTLKGWEAVCIVFDAPAPQ